MALTILICSKYPERAQMVHQWIQIANELRSSLGNLFGFSSVMAGLKTPQVSVHQGIEGERVAQTAVRCYFTSTRGL